MTGLRLKVLCGLAASLVSIGSAQAATLSTLYSISGGYDGASPSGTLFDVGGTFFGTTQSGGVTGSGTIYNLNPTTGRETVIYSFPKWMSPNTGLTAIGGVVYGTAQSAFSADHGVVFRFDPAAGSITVTYSFTGGADGGYPSGPLLAVGDTLYGTTSAGGTMDSGTVFKIDSVTGIETVLHSFGGGGDARHPRGGLIALNGVLYVTSDYGGSGRALGTVFKIDPSTGVESVVHNFNIQNNDGYAPVAALTQVGSALYGTAQSVGQFSAGLVFKIDLTSGKETILHRFSGYEGAVAFPNTALINVGGMLFGTNAVGGGAPGAGTVFEIDPVTGVTNVIYKFTGANNGSNPGGLLSANGILYGTTLFGGESSSSGNGYGTVFSVDPATKTQRVVYSFSPGSGLTPEPNGLAAFNGALFLSTARGGSASRGNIVKIDPVTAAATEIFSFGSRAVGISPSSALIGVRSTLYGTTYVGGDADRGTLFSIDPNTGSHNVIFSFTGANGSWPRGELLNLRDTVYGVTRGGGASDSGTVYGFKPGTGLPSPIYSFAGGSDGAAPSAALTSLGASLYGLTSNGGASNFGTVFKINPTTGAYGVVYSFAGGKDAAFPSETLTKLSGALYGVSSLGGGLGPNPLDYGLVFKISTVTGAERVLHRFTGGADGSYPDGPLLGINGLLYGTTSSGGAFDKGTVFSIHPVTGLKTILHNFTGKADGSQPGAALISIGTNVYGATNSGGASGLGTVFALIPTRLRADP